MIFFSSSTTSSPTLHSSSTLSAYSRSSQRHRSEHPLAYPPLRCLYIRRLLILEFSGRTKSCQNVFFPILQLHSEIVNFFIDFCCVPLLSWPCKNNADSLISLWGRRSVPPCSRSRAIGSSDPRWRLSRYCWWFFGFSWDLLHELVNFYGVGS